MPASAMTALKQPLDQFASILHTIGDHVSVIDRDYRLLWANQGMPDGRTVREIQGELCHELFQLRDRPCPECPVRRVFETGAPVVMEKWIPPEVSRTRRWGEAHVYPLRDSRGRVEAVVKIGFDVTARKLESMQRQRYLESLEASLQEADWAPLAGGAPGGDAARELGLTAREMQVLPLLGRGMTNRDISRVLGISSHTVKTHVTNIFNKLGVNDRTQTAVMASRLNLI